jgi:hypothetical protein
MPITLKQEGKTIQLKIKETRLFGFTADIAIKILKK